MKIAKNIYENDLEKNLLNKKIGKPPSKSSKDDSSSDKKVEPRVGIGVKKIYIKLKMKKDEDEAKKIVYKFKPLQYDLENAFTNEKIPNKFNNLKAINFEVKGLESPKNESDLNKNLLEYLNQPSSKSGGKKNKTKKQKTTKNTKTRKKSK